MRTDPKESHPAFPWVTFGLVKNVHCSQISGFCLTTVTVTVAKSTNSSREKGNWPNSHLGGFQLPMEGSSTLFVSLWKETSCGKYYCLLDVASLEMTQQWLFKYLWHHWKRNRQKVSFTSEPSNGWQFRNPDPLPVGVAAVLCHAHIL